MGVIRCQFVIFFLVQYVGIGWVSQMVQTSNSITSPSIGCVREYQEALEDQILSPYATRSSQTLGREVEEPLCPLRTVFQRDRDRILHSKAFRRLKHKTQVFFSPVGDHYRTRLTHTLEVSQVSRTIARALRLNEDLTEAIALGHDLGHPPFGHMGERILNELIADGFHHYLQSVRVARHIEKLNLSIEVQDSIAKDGAEEPTALEGQLVKMADRMAYLHHDVEDSIRAGQMKEEDLPSEIVSVLGRDRDTRLNRMILDIVHTSRTCFDQGKPQIALSPDVSQAMAALRTWMFEHIYLAPLQTNQSQKVRRLLSGLFEFFVDHPDKISPNIPSQDVSIERRAIDYIAGMTDRFAIDMYTRLLLPSPHQSHHEGRQFEDLMSL